MSRDKFRTVVTALITHKGKLLIGKKEERENHPIGGKWHVLGGHLDYGEGLKEAVKREVKEETDLEVEVRELVDVMSFKWTEEGEKDSLRFVYHVEADSKNANARDDLAEVRWVDPGEIVEELDTQDAYRLQNRQKQVEFLKRMNQK